MNGLELMQHVAVTRVQVQARDSISGNLLFSFFFPGMLMFVNEKREKMKWIGYMDGDGE